MRKRTNKGSADFVQDYSGKGRAVSYYSGNIDLAASKKVSSSGAKIANKVSPKPILSDRVGPVIPISGSTAGRRSGYSTVGAYTVMDHDKAFKAQEHRHAEHRSAPTGTSKLYKIKKSDVSQTSPNASFHKSWVNKGKYDLTAPSK